MIDINFDELNAFSDKIMGFDFKDIVREVALRLIRKVKKNTPVDTGNLRRNWQVGDILSDGDGYEVEIFNNVSYAEYVELGHRLVRNGVTIKWVNGKFMLRLSVHQIESELPFIVESFINRRLKNV